MFNKELMEQFKKLNGITDKVIMRYPITTLVSDANDMICNLKVDNFDTDSFNEFAIFELSKMINIFSLFQNYEVVNNEDHLLIRAGQKSSVLKKSDMFLLQSYDKPAALIESLKTSENVEIVSEFNLSVNDVNQMKKAIGILSDLEGVRFEGIDNNTKVSLVKVNKFEVDGVVNDTYESEYLNSSSKNFSETITKENFLKLPSMDYIVKIVYNTKVDAYRILFCTDNFEILLTVLAKN